MGSFIFNNIGDSLILYNNRKSGKVSDNVELNYVFLSGFATLERELTKLISIT